MLLTCLSSESAGNGYILQADTDTLLIECGVRLQVVKQALDYNMSNVVGCLISHSHGDHFKYHKDYAKAGITLYGNEDCMRQYDGHRGNIMTPNAMYRIGDFRVVPFHVPHGVKCFGFFIKHPEIGSLVFITDAAYVPNKFVGLNHIMVECNYSDEAMVSDRAVGHHMSLSTTMQFLKANDLSHTYNIILLHLSAGSSDAKQFIKSVQSIAPNANVMVADKDLKVQLINNPF